MSFTSQLILLHELITLQSALQFPLDTSLPLNMAALLESMVLLVLSVLSELLDLLVTTHGTSLKWCPLSNGVHTRRSSAWTVVLFLRAVLLGIKALSTLRSTRESKNQASHCFPIISSRSNSEDSVFGVQLVRSALSVHWDLSDLSERLVALDIRQTRMETSLILMGMSSDRSLWITVQLRGDNIISSRLTKTLTPRTTRIFSTLVSWSLAHSKLKDRPLSPSLHRKTRSSRSRFSLKSPLILLRSLLLTVLDRLSPALQTHSKSRRSQLKWAQVLRLMPMCHSHRAIKYCPRPTDSSSLDLRNMSTWTTWVAIIFSLTILCHPLLSALISEKESDRQNKTSMLLVYFISPFILYFYLNFSSLNLWEGIFNSNYYVTVTVCIVCNLIYCERGRRIFKV